LPVRPARSEDFPRKNSPSRWRFCPLSPLTFRFRVRPSGGASTYSRSVLGASRNLRTQDGTVKTLLNSLGALCDVSRLECALAQPVPTPDSVATRISPQDQETMCPFPRAAPRPEGWTTLLR